MSRFVVTGIGRSGTKYSSKLFSAAGIGTTWEAAFTVDRRHIKDLDYQGDSSWLSAPFLSELPAGTVVLHQTRNPLKWLQSWLKVTPRWPVKHIQFVNLHSKLFRWNRGEHPQLDMMVWVRWNRMIEEQVKKGGFPYLRYGVESLDQAKMLEIAALVGAQVNQVVVADALQTVSKQTNTSRRDPSTVQKHPHRTAPPEIVVPMPTWAGLPAGPELDAFKSLAVEYGYSVTDV